MKICETGISWVFILDGDNTLWDSNAIFTRAQMAALGKMPTIAGNLATKKGLEILRRIDDRLISHYGRHDYDSRALFLALLLVSRGAEEIRALRKATRMLATGLPPDLKDEAECCDITFRRELQSVPPLLPGVRTTLETLRRRPSSMILVSEGSHSRIRQIIRAFRLEAYFDRWYAGKKTYSLYRRALRFGLIKLSTPTGSRIKTMVVGDLLDKDIRMGNRIGATTVFCAGGYKSDQRPRGKWERPNYRIRNIRELIRIVKKEEGHSD